MSLADSVHEDTDHVPPAGGRLSAPTQAGLGTTKSFPTAESLERQLSGPRG
jgi:hypothetical protein